VSEMRPIRATPVHQTDRLAELVCSNSFRGAQLENAVGLLKEEMRRLGSLVLCAADATAVPAGRALAVDREAFARHVTDAIEAHPRIQIVHECLTRIPAASQVILATGPLTDPVLAAEIQELMGEESLYFYDAISPTLYSDSIDYDIVFRASRYEDGEGDYLNIPLDREQYENLVDALLEAETVPLHAFEKELYFEGCLPVEEMARRGPQTLAFGPLKPVGLTDPRTGRRPHAVIQLRQEDKAGVLFNMVGFQTKLRIADQRRIFRALPGLSEAVFARFGSVHRNTFVNAPVHLTASLEVKGRPGLYIAGQMAGVEGYVESAALGFVAGVNAAFAIRGQPSPPVPAETAHGALLAHLQNASGGRFQPSNVNYGLFPALSGAPRRMRRRERCEWIAERALRELAEWALRIEARPA
ncbi:MAG: methylenetetrahydrofolate--tRNA-(uracil(54)-C(5))-methyltransferase (FADH(2)-oxidizing) TrmFO, partial [Myxococcota bacterium]